MAPAAVCTAALPRRASPASAAFKKLEARRVARLKHVAHRVRQTLKAADVAARELLVQDLRDVADAAADLLAAADEPAPPPAAP
jgi:hypothetical protein